MIEMNNNLIKSAMDYQKMIEDGKQTAPKLDEVYKIKNLQPSQHKIRRIPMIIQAVIGIISGFTYIYYS